MTPDCKKSWRDVLPIHPAAELFPMMSERDLHDLGNDIRKRGLLEGVALLDGMLLDGRNRLDAMELVGIKLVTGHGQLDWANIAHRNVKGVDPIVFVTSKNLNRRHLNPEQKSELVGKILTWTPEKSNRAIAEVAKVSHVTVGKVRAELQSTGQLDQLAKTVGKDGKARKMPTTTHKPPTTTKQKDPAIAAAVERAVARSEESQRTQALISADACAAQDPVNATARFVVIEIIEKEAKRLSGEQRTKFLRYLRDEIDGLLHDTNAAVDAPMIDAGALT